MDKLSHLFTAYADDVFRLAYCYLGNRSDAEDVCQTVFLKLAEKNTVLLAGKEKHWLLKCTANACKNHLRFARVRSTDCPVEDADVAIPFAADSTEALLHDAVFHLPPHYRTVVHLYYFEGYDQSEIAKILGISRTAVQTRMSRARTFLKKELEDHA